MELNELTEKDLLKIAVMLLLDIRNQQNLKLASVKIGDLKTLAEAFDLGTQPA